jgi:hypothetical protein
MVTPESIIVGEHEYLAAKHNSNLIGKPFAGQVPTLSNFSLQRHYR